MGAIVAVTLLLLALMLAGATATGPSVIIVGAGFSGISAAQTLSDAGITDILILEATNRIGGRIHHTNFGGVQVELGANWVEGVHGKEINPIWTMANELGLRKFYSDFANLSSNFYKQDGGLYDTKFAQEAIDNFDQFYSVAENFSTALTNNGLDDMSILAFQRLMHQVPSDPLTMSIDYFNFDYEFAEPPRITSLQNTVPLATFNNFGEDVYFVADGRGYESVVHHVAEKFLKTKNNVIIDPRLKLNKVVRHIRHTKNGVVVKTEDGSTYRADYVMLSVSVGVLQTNLIKFQPDLPLWKILAIYEFDMAVYTKIFLKFPYKFWPDGKGTEFFVYASERRGYYPVWQQLEQQYPGENVLLVTVTDQESRRIEHQSDEKTKAEAMEVLRKMFGNDIPDATDILVPKWWSDRFYKGTFSNWPIGVSRYEYDQIRAPVERIYFTGEHTSENYNGYVHGAYLSGIHSANMMIDCIKWGACNIEVKPKDWKATEFSGG